MSRRDASWLAWSLCGLAVALNVASMALAAADTAHSWSLDQVAGVPLLVLSVVGALIAVRHPGNAIGWLFCGAGLLIAVAGATYGYADYALTVHPGLHGGVVAAWLTSWIFLPALFGVPPLLFLLFPDGRPPSRRWGLAVGVTVVALTCQTSAAAFSSGPLEDTPVEGLENPVSVGAGVLLDGVELAGWSLGLLSVVLAVCSLVVRFRRSRGDERLQLRWLVSSAVLFGLACLVSAVLFQTRLDGLGQLLILSSFCTIPVMTGVAILRHRLYDIDVVINRTLVYGALTATLAGLYLGSVLLLQLVLNPVTEQSDLAVAGSTLVVAALFRPARARIQGVVDRRFYRRRYDAVRTLDDFAARLRHELDLEAMGADLRSAVRETVQPAHVSLWLRP